MKNITEKTNKMNRLHTLQRIDINAEDKNMDKYTFKVSGVTHENYQEAIKWLIEDAGLKEFALERINHPKDPHAIMVTVSGVQFGWVPRELNQELAAAMDKGEHYYAELVQLNKHPDYPIIGVTVRLRKK